MRKLMWCTIGFGAGCGCCAYLCPDSILIPLLMFAAAGILIGLYSQRINPMELMVLGGLLGVFWYGGFDHWVLDPVQALDGQEVLFSITVTDYSWETDYGRAADGTIFVDGKAYSIRFYYHEDTALLPGDAVTGTFRLRYTPGGEEAATFHPGRGIFLLGYQRGEVRVDRGTGDAPAFLGPELRHWIQIRLRMLFPQDVFPFTQALLLGDGTELDYETDTAFKLSGIRHIIAVSGLHVMLLYSLLSTVTFRNKWLTALLTLPVLALFAAAAGFTPSVTRASIMVALMVLARLFNREYDPPTALSFSALVMLLANPLVISSASFQLTVGCVVGIQLLGNPIRKWLKLRWKEGKGGVGNALKRWISSSASVTLGAMSLTTPLCACYFGTVSLVGILTNLLTMWVVNLIFNGMIVTLLVSLISLKWAAMLAELLAWPIRFVLGTAKLLGGLPLSAVYTVSPYILGWLVFVYLLLTIFFLGFRKRPALLVCCGGIGLCIALVASWAEPRLDECRVTMLDVGQGQCILLQSGGSNFLVDCGGDREADAAGAAAEMLLSQGITRLDGIILTHWDADHAGGVSLLLRRVEAEALYAPVPESDGLSGIWVTEQRQVVFDTGKLTIFPGKYVEEHNENSLCVLFETKNCAILITGDRSSLGEFILLQEGSLPKVDLLVAGHHGSKNSTSEALLNAVQPEVVFISAGQDNSYGHPAPELLLRLSRFGCRVYRTDISGTLIFRR